MGTLKDTAAIVGIGETKVGELPNSTPIGLHAEAAKYAIEDAGLKKDDIDGLLTGQLLSRNVGRIHLILLEYMQMPVTYGASISLGGSAQISMAIYAAAAINAGLANTVLCVAAENPRTTLTRRGVVERMAKERHPTYEQPYGLMGPACMALMAQRHMYEYGTTSEQLAAIAVACHKHASMNPNAQMREPITIEDVLNSKMISTPLHILECALISDGGAAFIVTSAERARDLRKPPVYLMGAGEGQTHEYICGAPDLTTLGGKISGKRAFEMAGITPKDIDVAMIFDPFTIEALINIEDHGFCKKGEGGAFVEGGRIELGGELPINTHGGALAHAHVGWPTGIFHVTEAVRQLRGEAGERQVKDAEIALVHGAGAMAGCHSTIILRR